MVLIRLSYAADLPDPAQLLKTLKDQPDGGGSLLASGGNISRAGGSTPTGRNVDGAPAMVEAPIGGGRGDGPRAALAVVPRAEVQSVIAIKTLEDVISILEDGREILLASQVYQFVHLVKLEEGRLEIRPEPEAHPRLAQDLGQALGRLTGNRWMVSISAAPGALTLAEVAQAERQAEIDEVLQTESVRAIMEVFPEAELVAINKIENNKE